jgi:hypothetical protein
MKTAMTICLVLGSVICIWQIVISIRGSYEYERTVAAEWSLADKSSTIPAKGQHLDKFVAALEGQGFQGQYNAVIFPTPDNSFDTNLEALKTLQNRLHEIEKMDVSSFQYQTAIQQITAQEQGEARKMLQVFEGVWWKTHHLMAWDWIQFLWVSFGIILLSASLVIAFLEFG